jgi:hypothetical protein
MSKDTFLEEISEKYANDKANIIDQHLIRFLCQQGLANKGTVEEIKGNLKSQGFELVTQIDRTLTQEVYTFKLCKVYQSTQLVIPNPTIISAI